MQVVHRVVFFADPRGLLRVAGDQYLLCAVAQFDCDTAHFGEVTVHLFGQRMLGMAAPGDLGDVQRQRAHPVDVGDDLNRADDRAQVSGDRCLQRKQHECRLLGAGAQRGDLLVVGDDLLGQHQIGLKQGLRRALHRNTRQPAHLAELICQGIQLLVVRGSHEPSLRADPSNRHDVDGERKVNATCPNVIAGADYSQVVSAALVTVRSSGRAVGVLLVP